MAGHLLLHRWSVHCLNNFSSEFGYLKAKQPEAASLVSHSHTALLYYLILLFSAAHSHGFNRLIGWSDCHLVGRNYMHSDGATTF